MTPFVTFFYMHLHEFSDKQMITGHGALPYRTTTIFPVLDSSLLLSVFAFVVASVNRTEGTGDVLSFSRYGNQRLQEKLRIVRVPWSFNEINKFQNGNP